MFVRAAAVVTEVPQKQETTQFNIAAVPGSTSGIIYCWIFKTARNGRPGERA